MRLNNSQRKALSDSFAKLSTYILTGLIIANILRPQRITIAITILGVLVCVGLFVLAVIIVSGNEDD